MYIVTISTDGSRTEIHNVHHSLVSGNVVKGINSIDSFSFCMLPTNPGFKNLKEHKTLVSVYNTRRKRYEFYGRVLYSNPSMSDKGLIKHDAVAESYMGFLCDSEQPYVAERNWTVKELLQHIIDQHNSQVEPYKHFTLGEVTVTDPNDNVYLGIQRENTWETLKKKLVEKLGGELSFRVGEAGLYLDYLTQIGEHKTTKIALSRNMKSITKEKDTSAFVTRLIPLGAKKTESSEERIDITSVNDGLNYIVDEGAEAAYGISVRSEIWDDVNNPEILLTKGQKWIQNNNKVLIKYSVTALDLSLLDLEIDDFEVGNYYPIVNPLLNIDDTARIIKKNINICDETKSTIEVGDNFKTQSDIQRDQALMLQTTEQKQQKLEIRTGTVEEQIAQLGKDLENTETRLEESFTSKITQFSDSISLSIDGSLGSNASIILSANGNKYTGEMDLSQVRKAFADDSTAVSITAGTITFNAGTLIINSSKFTLDASGGITATDATIYGDIITIDGSFKTEMDKGSLRLYYDDVLCGTINTKYWTGAATEGISLRVEEGGNYIMFSHADDTQGSGYKVDYYLNAGWSDNYEEMHIFQTSARFLSDVYFDGKADIGSLVLRGPGGKRYLVTAYDGVLECSEI